MEPVKHSNSDVSSPESDQKPEKSSEDSTGIGRSYECTFCKRGFTNAQALGGHMNIHRKDKAKAKQKNQENIHNVIKPNENYPNLRYFSQTDHIHQQQQQTNYYRPVGGYQVYLPSSTNPSFQTGNNYLPVWAPQHFESHVDANLSLRIGSVNDGEEDGQHEEKNVKEVEVDLELRLGHDPR